MKLRVFKLFFKNPCHFGELGLGIEKSSFILHSDTIFNALVNSWAYLFGKEETEELLERILKENLFLISSGFPFSKDNYYFPSVKWPFPVSESFREKHSKTLKSLKFVSKELFEKWINGQVWEEQNLGEKLKIDFIKEELIPKNQISRIKNQSQIIYHLGVIKFKEKTGIWFVIEEKKQGVIKDYIIPALIFLQDKGIGGKRTWGLGKFKFEEEELEIKTPQNSEKFVSLSSIFPAKEDLFSFKKNNWFNWYLIQRGGYPVYSPFLKGFSLRKPLIKMIGEGSVAPKISGEILKIPENEEILKKINFPHFVYHYGKAFLIKANLKENYD